MDVPGLTIDKFNMVDAKQVVDYHMNELSMQDVENSMTKIGLVINSQLTCCDQQDMGWHMKQELAKTMTRMVT